MSESIYPLCIKNLELNTITIGDTPYGKGVFASKDIKAQTPIGAITGEFQSDPEYASDYAMSFNGGALEPNEPYRLVNHSCDPNCELTELVVEDEINGKTFHELWIYSTKDISSGEQLTIDYSWPAFNAMPCLCGSPLCRGWIVDPDELSVVVAERGLGSLEKKTAARKVKKSTAKKTVDLDDTTEEKTAKKTAKKAVKKAAKKSVVKKTAVKKAAVKKTVAKKSVAKKTVAKKTAAVKEAVEKKASAKKAVKKAVKKAAKKTAVKKSVKKTTAKKATKKTAV